MHWFTSLFLGLLAASTLTRLWLCQWQIGHIRAHFGEVPAAFADKISINDHQRAAEYSCTNLRIAGVQLGWDTLWLLLWTIGGGINLIDQWWMNFDYPPLVTGIAVIVSLTLIMAIVNLPSSLYQTFVTEERFGFNQTRFMTWALDLSKTTLLMMLLGIPLLGAILWLMNQAGNSWWWYAWLLWMSFSLVMIWAYPAFIAPLFDRFKPLQDGELRTRIERLLQCCGFQGEGVFIVDGSKRSTHGNAYFTGVGKHKRLVFYDTLLESLSQDEVEAVLAHESGHFKRNHIKKSLLLSSGMSLLGFALLAWLMQSNGFYSAFGVVDPSTHTALILFMLILPVFIYFISPMFSALSRKHEFEADEFAHSTSDYKALISALVGLHRDNTSTLTADPIHSMFYDSHPPASIRIHRLEAIGNSSVAS